MRCAMGRCRARKGGPLQQAGACAPPADQAGGERFGTWVRHAGNEALETEVCCVTLRSCTATFQCRSGASPHLGWG